VLRDGNIGPYSPLTLGRPTLPLYLTAPVIATLGNTIVAIRIVEAVAGALTALALFVILWRYAGIVPAVLGASILAIMTWHLHLSRTGFNAASWVLFAVLGAGLVLEAIARHDWRWWLAAGAVGGLGVYTYQAQWLYLGLLGLFVFGYAVITWWRERTASVFVGIGVWVVGLAVAATPMVLYALDSRTGYFGYFNIVSVFTKPAWESLSTPMDQFAYLAGRYGDFWVRACCRSVVDGTDGTGMTPLLPLALVALALAGVTLGLWRHWLPLVWLSVLAVVLMPLAAVGTLDGPARRTFAMVPFIALLAGLGLAELIALARRRGALPGLVAGVAAAGVVAVLAYQGVSDYFSRFWGTAAADRWVYVSNLTAAAQYMAALPPGSRVYFAADRWSVHYETIQYLAPGVAGEDRLSKFGSASTDVDPTLGRPVFVLMEQFRSRLDDLQSRYPGGTVTVAGPTADPDFIAYSGFPVSQ
jgi:4-amino-4-deoxy-L-arabinose transferase-like glycosyltransferase